MWTTNPGRIQNFFCLMLVALFTIPQIGCGGGDGKSLAYCKGQVTLNGEPLSYGTVTFFLPSEGIGASAELTETGEFTLPESIQAGEYQVTVSVDTPSPLELETNPELATSRKPLPEKYRDPHQSGLVVILQPGRNTPLIELKE